MYLSKKIHNTAKLISANRVIQQLYTMDFCNAAVDVTSLKLASLDGACSAYTAVFRIEGFGHGIARVVAQMPDEVVGFWIEQYTLHPDIMYTEFYSHKHGNTEIGTFLHPLLESKLLPIITRML